MRRFYEGYKPADSLPANLRGTGTYNGTAIDTGGSGAIGWVLSIGVVTSGGTVSLQIQESDDGSSWSDVSGASIGPLGAAAIGTSPTIDINLGQRANRKRYERARATVENNSMIFGVTATLARREGEPVVNTPATVFV